MGWNENTLDARIPSFCSILAIGASNSGKSVLSCEVALKRNEIFDQEHVKVIIWYLYPQQMFLDIQEKDKSIVLVKTKAELEKELVERCLIIFDDQLLNSVGPDNDYITRFFNRKISSSFMYNFFPNTSLLPPQGGQCLGSKCQPLCFFKTFNDSNIQRFFRNFGSDSDFLFKAYKLAVEGKKYAHFFASFHAQTHDKLRFRSSIIPGTGVEVYIKEHHDD